MYEDSRNTKARPINSKTTLNSGVKFLTLYQKNIKPQALLSHRRTFPQVLGHIRIGSEIHEGATRVEPEPTKLIWVPAGRKGKRIHFSGPEY